MFCLKWPPLHKSCAAGSLARYIKQLRNCYCNESGFATGCLSHDKDRRRTNIICESVEAALPNSTGQQDETKAESGGAAVRAAPEFPSGHPNLGHGDSNMGSLSASRTVAAQRILITRLGNWFCDGGPDQVLKGAIYDHRKQAIT